MKTPSDDLFQIIRAMDSHEKRFFKLYSRRAGQETDLSYMVLFDVIDAMEAYDEKVLLQKLSKKGFAHNLNKAKNYLTEALLSTLAEYNQDASVHSRIQRYIAQAEQLYNKQLYGSGSKVLAKAEKLVDESELYAYRLIINDLRAAAFAQHSRWQDAADFLASEIAREEENIQKLLNAVSYRNLSLKVAGLRGIHGQAITPAHFGFLKKDPLFSSEKKALSYPARRNYAYVRFMKHAGSREWKEACECQQKWVAWLEADKEKLPSRAGDYLVNLSYLLVALAKTRKEKETEHVLEKGCSFYDELPPRKKNRAMAAIFSNFINSYMFAQMTGIRPANAIRAWERVKDMVQFEQMGEGLKIALSANLFACYFYQRNFREALKWLNRIILFEESNRIDIQAQARIALLMTHYEMGNVDLLAGMAKSARKWLKKHERLSPYTGQVLDFFGTTLLKAYDKNEVAKAFAGLKQKLTTCKKDMVMIPDMEHWLDSMISGKQVVDILREKVSKGELVITS